MGLRVWSRGEIFREKKWRAHKAPIITKVKPRQTVHTVTGLRFAAL